jgi:hypothetical protein
LVWLCTCCAKARNDQLFSGGHRACQIADTSRQDLTPQSAGLYAISLGLSQRYADDHEMLAHALIMYDALYAWCKECQGESHNWPPQM